MTKDIAEKFARALHINKILLEGQTGSGGEFYDDLTNPDFALVCPVYL